MIKSYSLKALQKAINHTLALDETRLPKIKALQGKVIELIVKPLNVTFFIEFNDERMELHPSYDGEADTIIQSSPLGLIRLSLLPASKVRSLFNDHIKITGDVELGQEVKRLFDELDIDWEGHLAQFTGDVVAHQVGSFFRKGRAFHRQVRSSLQSNLTEYLHEELRLVPFQEEVDDFFNDVDDLSLTVERLAAQINLLMAQDEID